MHRLIFVDPMIDCKKFDGEPHPQRRLQKFLLLPGIHSDHARLTDTVSDQTHTHTMPLGYYKLDYLDNTEI